MIFNYQGNISHFTFVSFDCSDVLRHLFFDSTHRLIFSVCVIKR